MVLASIPDDSVGSSLSNKEDPALISRTLLFPSVLFLMVFHNSTAGMTGKEGASAQSLGIVRTHLIRYLYPSESDNPTKSTTHLTSYIGITIPLTVFP